MERTNQAAGSRTVQLRATGPERAAPGGIGAPLNIRIVGNGIYEGFNPVVAMSAKLVIMVLVTVLVFMPELSGRMIETLKSVTLTMFAGWYIYLLAALLLVCAAIVALPFSGRVRLGPDESRPEHSTLSWLAMMFCAGIGSGSLAFAVSEPVSHFLTNPDLMGGTVSPGEEAAMVSAMRFVFLHWGFSGWATYAVVGLGLGLACHRYGQPMTMRSGLAPLFGKRLEGTAGHMVDIVSVLAIVAGVTTSVVLGVEQICSGLSILTGNPFFVDNSGNPTLVALLTALVFATAVAIASVVSGVERGVKWVSQLGLALAASVFVIFVLFGGGTGVCTLFAEGASEYLRNFVAQSTTLYDATGSEESRAQRDWQGDWTIFYWAWWIAFAPFVGVFVARISRGRTLREFVLGAILAPTLMCFFWFAGTGGSALILELDGTAGGAILSYEHAFRIYETVDIMLAPGIAIAFKAVLVVFFLVLIVSCSTAAIIAVKSIGAAGSDLAETPAHSILWAFVIAANAGAIMAVGGVGSIRDVMIISAVPSSIIIALMVPSVALMIRHAKRGT